VLFLFRFLHLSGMLGRMKPISFTIEAKLKDTLGRAGVIHTPHGDIHTPAFVLVGTKATVRGVPSDKVEEVAPELIIANTYHLFNEPGQEVVRDAGGLHKFMNWKGPLMTDSGGFQVFSLGAAYGKGISKIIKPQEENLLQSRFGESEPPKIVSIESDGAAFKSPRDGTVHFFSPERSIGIQHDLGADIIFVFDECTSPMETEHYQREALDRTHRWAQRCLTFHESVKEKSETQGLYGIVQGGRHEHLRRESARALTLMSANGREFDGFGIGGSFEKADIATAARWANEELPEGKPRHLLGIGEPEDLFDAVEAGCDTFDCVSPTRLGRHGTVYSKNGKIHLANAPYVRDFNPIESDCGCYTCKNFTRSYVSHLLRSKEMLGGTLASIHNIYFLVNLVKKMRSTLIDGSWHVFKDSFLGVYKAGNQ